MLFSRLFLAYTIFLIYAKNVICQEIDRGSGAILDNILDGLHGLGYSQIKQENLLNSVFDIINGDIDHFNTFCVNSLLNYYRNSPNEIWANERFGQISIEKVIQNFILVCRELPEWQNVCHDRAAVDSLIATDIHLAMQLTMSEKPDISIDSFCNLNLYNEDNSLYNHLCVDLLASNQLNIGISLALKISDSLTICSMTTLWSKTCANAISNDYTDVPELHLIASSLFFEVSRGDKHFPISDGIEGLTPADFCGISERIVLKGDVLKYFNAICVDELSNPSKLTVSGRSWLPSTNSVFEMCISSPLWISCTNNSFEKDFEVHHITQDNKDLNFVSINGKISLLATTLLQKIHQLPLFMFSSQYYQFATLDDLCNIAGIIHKDISAIQDEEVSIISQIGFGRFFNSICWRVVSVYKITFITSVGAISHPITTLEAVSICSSSTLFWVNDCKAEDSDGLIDLHQISILSQELFISSKKYYSLPENTFCTAAKNIISALNNLNGGLGSSTNRLGDFSINWVIKNINLLDSNNIFSGIQSGYFNRECIRELMGKNEVNSDYIPINFAIFICSSSLRWESCAVNGNTNTRFLKEFIASEFYYGLLAEVNDNTPLNWNDLCLISESIIPKEYNSVDSFPVIPYFNHYCSLSFIKNIKLIRKKYNISFIDNKLYTFTDIIKVCVHNYFWRVPCGEIVELDLLANSLLFGSHQFDSMQDISESQFCKAANNLLDVDPTNFEGECIRELMKIGTQFTSEVAEGACAVTHRSLVCHGYPDEYSHVAATLFKTMYAYFPISEIANFIEFCEIVHSIFTDYEIKDSPYFFNAICAKQIHNSNLDVSFLTISILCSHISPNMIENEDYSVSLLASEFYKKSRTINSLKKWEMQYFYPLAKRILENMQDPQDFSNFNYKCVSLTRSVISTDSFTLKLDDAISLCSGSIAFRTYCTNQSPDIQHFVSEIIQGMKLTYKISSFDESEIKSICNVAQLIYSASIESQPISRNTSSNSKKYPYFLHSCVEVLISRTILPNKFIEISIDNAISICTQSLRSSTPCKSEKPIVSVISVGLYTEMQYLPEMNTLKVTDLCNFASKISEVNTEEYLETCYRYLGDLKSYIPVLGNSAIKLNELQKQRICTKPFKWPKCNIDENKLRGVHSIKLENLASKLKNIFSSNGVGIWKFERYCAFAEKLLSDNGENDFSKCIQLLEEFEYVEMIKQSSEVSKPPLFLFYKLEDKTKGKICNLLSSNSSCIHSRNGLSGLIASNFFSISTKYLDLNAIKSSDFCIISELLLQSGSIQEIRESCPYILLQITNLEHWPQIMLTPELTHTICDNLSITNVNCIPANSDWGITDEMSSGINEIAIELFFIRKKYVPAFNPESSCEMAESLIQYGIKNEYFNNLCINLISYDIWSFSENFDSRYAHYWNIGRQDPVTFIEFIKSEASQHCKELEEKLSKIYLKSHNFISKRNKRDSKVDDRIYYQKILRRFLNPLNFLESGNTQSSSGIKTKKEERIELKRKLRIISKAKGYVALNDEAIKDYSPEAVDYKLAKKYFANFPEDIRKLSENSDFVFKMPEFNWNLFSEKLSIVSKNNLGVSIKLSDPKFGGITELIQKWGYSPQGTIKGAQYIYRVSRYINKYMISPKKAYLIWKETLIAMNFAILPKWRDSWQDEIRKPTPLDEQPLPSCEGVKSSKVLKQLGMDRKKISMVALANIDSFVAQMTEAAHDLKLSNVKFSDLCLVGIILFNIKSYSRTESFNYQCTKWVKEVGYVDDYVDGISSVENVTSLSKKIVSRLKNSVRRQIPTGLARKICASTNRWMSCNSGLDIDEKLNIDNLATELVRLSRISGLEFRDMCEVSIQIANSPDFNQKCPVVLQQIIGNYNRSHQICRSTSYWKSCKYSNVVSDLKLREHLDILTSELTIGLNEIFPNVFSFEEICYLSDRIVASEYFKTDCVRALFDFLVSQRFNKPTLNVYGDTKPSVSFKHIVSVSLTICYDTLRWQQATCVLDNENQYSLYEKQLVDLVSEEILKEMVKLNEQDSQISIFFKDKERDKLLDHLNRDSNSKFRINLPPPIKYRDICSQATNVSKARYFNINCIQTVTEIFQVQISKISLDGEKFGSFESNNIYSGIVKTPDIGIIEKICKGSMFWETCSNKHLRPLFKFDIDDESKENVDIIANDLLVSTLQLNENGFRHTDEPQNGKVNDLNNIHALALKTVHSLSYLDFCEISIWYSRQISNTNKKDVSELQNLLSDKILVLILENMYPNRRVEKNQAIEESEDEVIDTLDRYIEDSLQKLPKTSPRLVSPPDSMLRNLTSIEPILIYHSDNYSNNIFRVDLLDFNLYQDFYVKRHISTIDRDNNGKFLYVKPAVGLRLFKYQLPNGSTKYSKVMNMGKDRTSASSKSNRSETINILNLMRKTPTNFHSSILPHATKELIEIKKPTAFEKRIKREWYRKVKKEYYYRKGRITADEEWRFRQIALANNNGTGEIAWETEKIKVPNFIQSLFNSEVRKQRREGKLYSKGLYKARVHKFLLEKFANDLETRRENHEKTGEIVLKSNRRENTHGGKSEAKNLDNLYSEHEVNIVSSIAALIGYNQIAIDLF
ncbi:large cysteine rich protein [Cryptosporidium canis]|nr:large cysteine rich protein [Cryptosporidium canis]